MKLTKRQRELILDAIAEKLAASKDAIDRLRLVHEWSGTERTAREIANNEASRDEWYFTLNAFRSECDAADRLSEDAT